MSIKWALVVAALAAACSNGAGAQDSTTSAPSTTSALPAATTSTTATTPATASAPPTTAATTTTTEPPPPDPTYYVFMPRGLPDDFVTRVRQIHGVSDIALVTTETLHISHTTTATGDIVDEPRAGYVIPVQGIAINPEAHAPMLSTDVADTVLRLAPNEVLLGAASAELRRLDVGDTITFDDNRVVTVAGIVADPEFGNEELVTVDPTLVGGDRSELRFAVVRFAGDEVTLQSEVQQVLPDDAAFRVHPRGQPEDQSTAVRSQIWIKQTFGEFAYRPGGFGGSFTIDPDWVRENIVTESVPLLGTVRCHRVFVDILRDVMAKLEADGHTDIIRRSAYRGCFNPRYIANSYRMSRHAWGAAADINFFNELNDEPGSPVHPALLATMAEFGMTSGHNWSIPDPGHFEYYGFPEDE